MEESDPIKLEEGVISVENIKKEMAKYISGFIEVKQISDKKAIVYIDDLDMAAAIGKGGKNIAKIVKKVGISLDLKPRSELEKRPMLENLHDGEILLSEGITLSVDQKNITLVSLPFSGKSVDVTAGKTYLFTAIFPGDGVLTLRKNTSLGKDFINRIQKKEVITFRPL